MRERLSVRILGSVRSFSPFGDAARIEQQRVSFLFPLHFDSYFHAAVGRRCVLKRVDELAEDLNLPRKAAVIEMSGSEPAGNGMPDNTREI